MRLPPFFDRVKLVEKIVGVRQIVERPVPAEIREPVRNAGVEHDPPDQR